MRASFLLVAPLAFVAAVATAQTAVLTPTTVEFTASPDHNTLLEGVPILTRYEMRHYLEGASSPVQVIDLGKPTPNGENKIVAVNAAWFAAAAIVPNTRYVARVAAIGPGGEGESLDSNPFARPGPPASVLPPVIR